MLGEYQKKSPQAMKKVIKKSSKKHVINRVVIIARIPRLLEHIPSFYHISGRMVYDFHSPSLVGNGECSIMQ